MLYVDANSIEYTLKKMIYYHISRNIISKQKTLAPVLFSLRLENITVAIHTSIVNLIPLEICNLSKRYATLDYL